MKNIVYKSIFGITLIAGCICPENFLVAASVWKVSDSSGKVLYLGGSIHALRSTDYPLPSEYARACDASNQLVFEIDSKEMGGAGKSLFKAGEYPSGDSLKKHVDPRTYDYVRRFFGALNVPESKFAKFRPWYLAAMLQAPQLHGLSSDLGVEGFLKKRASSKSKPTSGLETLQESVQTLSGLSDRQSEAMLLISFIPGPRGTGDRLKEAWRKGDADRLWTLVSGMFADVPSIADRMITRRNHNWLPKIDGFMQSNQTYFVVVGAGHMGGPNGLLTLLRQRGYKIDQL
ncbi:MAG TPA: TraB/GumN family protein [Chthoniobacterales bacterium]|nr:TraB/GumN family protein [Chthoniobacterales bacterium]